MRPTLIASILVACVMSAPRAQSGRKPLSPADITDIATLLKLEDIRLFDEVTLAGILKSSHPEVRRRAVQSIGRIVNEGGRALLVSARQDADVDVVATVAFASGQLKDPGAVAWLDGLLSSPGTPAPVAKEAAIALGKIRTAEARAALAKYLLAAPATAAAVPVVGEALLAIGRFTGREDLSPMVKWSTSSNADLRWRAAWALYRPRDPAAVPTLLTMTRDASGDVRFWAVRGLGVPQAPAAGRRGAPPATPPPAPLTDAERERNSARLREAVTDPDRRVRTEALRTLAGYDDDASFAVVLAALESPDTWLSVSAAEALGAQGRYASRAEAFVQKLVAAAAPSKPRALRITALTPLVSLAPAQAVEIADSLARDSSLVARLAGVAALNRLDAAGRAKLDALAADPATKALIPPSGRGQGARPPAPVRTEADYRAIVERWIVPDYNGAPKPRATWTTPRGPIEIELYPGDAPMGVAYFVSLVESGGIVGTEFGRLVPNFVAQQRTIDGALTLRDEVNRRGLTRANLSWASAGLDTGRPGYTLGNTPQPHNEGDFTALGHVVRGMDVVDRLELGDAVTATRMIR
ncbi:MAG TPA: HEAT repeat domain-containing protein [Vicinamibacterales bacterium]|nr:HEAT repeat domain-containing protein [Vicinamibacterales bacterium]